MDEPDAHTVQTVLLDPMGVWRSKEEWSACEQRSREVWDEMADDERELLLKVVRVWMDRLYDSVEIWVPYSLRPVGGTGMDITFRVLFASIDAELKNSEYMSDRRIQAAREAIVKMVDELNEKPV